MKTKNAHAIGASVGLAAGMLMFVIGLLLRGHSDSFLSPFLITHSSAMRLLVCVHGSSYDWNTSSGLCELLLGFLFNWTLLGFVIGLGWREFFKP